MRCKFNKKFLSTALTLSGTMIGAGILGLPYVFASAGFSVGLFWLFLLGITVLLGFLYLGEVTLRTKENHQLPGLAKLYLGPWGEKIMLIAVAFGIYSSLLAYLVGQGESLSILIFGVSGYGLYLGLAFGIFMSILLWGGLSQLRKVETYGVIAILVIVFGVVIYYFPQISYSNFGGFSKVNFLLPIGAVLFALLGFTSIPELRMEIRGSEKNLKWAITLGFLISFILYFLFAFVSVGVFGNSIYEIATLSFGPPMVILGIFTMLTSYFVLGFSLKDMYRYDFYRSKTTSYFWAAIFPLILFVIVSLFGIGSFVEIISIGGIFSGGTVAILSVLMNYSAKKNGKRKPEYSVPINLFIVILFCVIFISGMIAKFIF